MIPALIKTDKETLAKIQEVAGGRSVSAFIREVAAAAGPPPETLIEEKLSRIEKRLDSIESDIMSLFTRTLSAVLGVANEQEKGESLSH